MSRSNVRSKPVVSRIANSILWLSLMLGKRSARPVNAADVASQPRPSWVAYASGARVTSLPVRTSWEPRYKAGTDETESLDYRESALPAGARRFRCPDESRRRGREPSGGGSAPGRDDHGLARPSAPDESRVLPLVRRLDGLMRRPSSSPGGRLALRYAYGKPSGLLRNPGCRPCGPGSARTPRG
jgi:hypothetical protein